MKKLSRDPRLGVAILLGLLSALSLTLLVMNGEGIPRFYRLEEPDVILSSGTLQVGDTLSTLLASHGIRPLTIAKIERTLGKTMDFRKMQPRDQYAITTSTSGEFKAFTYHTSPVHAYVVTRSSMGVYTSEKRSEHTVWMDKRIRGVITENLYKDLLSQGYAESFVANLVADLADNIFAWRIDFFTEQRAGDRFNILLEQEFLVGSDKPLWNGRGRILAASYTGQGTHQKENFAFRYKSSKDKRYDYYDKKGKAVRKAFLRAPFTHGVFRISSRFSLRRFHPILRRYRPHHGIDYAAPIGTPVASVGKGRVVYAGRRKAYGKSIDIRHTKKYTSRYGHLSRIAVKKGDTVYQGQYIGKVGSTGLSTGPHLHFEMLVDGVRRNFLRLHFPSASSVSATNLADFKRERDEMLDRLEANPA